MITDTFNRLKKINGLTLGVHTVISRYNAGEIKEIYDHFMKMEPDSFICEIAEKRKELGNKDLDIEPSYNEYCNAIDYVAKKERKTKGISTITKILRKKYYDITKYILKNNMRKIICLSGSASAHIGAKGELWACCMKCESMGNLKNEEFGRIWKGKKAQKIRAGIRKRRCFCTLANATYSNILCDPI